MQRMCLCKLLSLKINFIVLFLNQNVEQRIYKNGHKGSFIESTFLARMNRNGWVTMMNCKHKKKTKTLSHVSRLNLLHCAVNRENLIWNLNNLPENTGKEIGRHSRQLKLDLLLRVCIRAVLCRTHGFHKEGQRAGSTAVQHPWVFYQPPWLCHSWGTLPSSLLEIKPTTLRSSFPTKHLFLLNAVEI